MRSPPPYRDAILTQTCWSYENWSASLCVLSVYRMEPKHQSIGPFPTFPTHHPIISKLKSPLCVIEIRDEVLQLECYAVLQLLEGTSLL